MTDAYCPPGYIGTHGLLSSVYQIKYPEPGSDPVVLETVSDIALARLLHTASGHNPELWKGNADKKRPAQFWGASLAGVEQLILARGARQAIDTGQFDPILAFFAPRPKYTWTPPNLETTPPWVNHQTPHKALMDIGSERAMSVTNSVRDKLIGGSIRCFVADVISGIEVLKNDNIWLSDSISHTSLRFGGLTFNERDYGQKLLFLKDEVSDVFSMAEKEQNDEVRRKSRPGRPQVWLNIALHLKEFHPGGQPEGSTVGEWHKQVQDEMGMTFKKDAFLNARNFTYEGKGAQRLGSRSPRLGSPAGSYLSSLSVYSLTDVEKLARGVGICPAEVGKTFFCALILPLWNQ